MAYKTKHRVELGPTAAGVSGVRIHEDRGDGTAQCAVGTQYPDPADWHDVGEGMVDCLLCAEVQEAAVKRVRRAPLTDEQRRELIKRELRRRQAARKWDFR